MQNRRWLLVGAAFPIVYGFLLIRLDAYLRFMPTYGEADIYAASALAIALLAAWTVLEVTYTRQPRAATCLCGYSLRGVRCPECGGVQGEPVAGDTASP